MRLSFLDADRQKIIESDYDSSRLFNSERLKKLAVE